MSFQRISKLPILREFLYRLAKWRVEEKLNKLIPHCTPTDNVLDVGSGNGVLCHQLRKRNYRVTPLDIENLSIIDSIKPIIYDGVRMPFGDARFDVALLITVLHHTRHPEYVLMEAKRVAKRIIVIEEIYSNTFNKYLTYFIDSVFNIEFFDHPRTNKSDANWRDVFERLGLKLVHAQYSRSILLLRRAIYVLDKDNKELDSKPEASGLKVIKHGRA